MNLEITLIRNHPHSVQFQPKEKKTKIFLFCIVFSGDVEHFYIPLEVQNGNIVSHPKLRIVLYNGAVLQPGYAGNAASMSGYRQYFTLGDHKEDCMGNLGR